MLINSPAEFDKPQTYRSMFNGTQAMFKMATVGFVPHLARNLLMTFGVLPSGFGATNELFMGIYALGAVAISHPFEVARILMVKNGGGQVRATLSSLYEAEGLAGIYKGFIPRALLMVPIMVAM